MLTIAMIGVQHYHANFWTRAFQQSPDAEMRGVWDPDATRAANAVASWSASTSSQNP